MFNEDSAMPEHNTGHNEIREIANGITSVLQMAAQQPNETPSVESGSGELPWYLAGKYEKRNNKSGNGWHLAPLATYVQDVIAEADFQTSLKVDGFLEVAMKDGSTEKDDADQDVQGIIDRVQRSIGRDSSNRQALSILRYERDRLALSLKITGASAIDNMLRVQHANLTGGDIEAVKQNEYYQKNAETCEYYARDAVYRNYIWTSLADLWKQLEQPPVDFPVLIERLLYDDAVQAGNRYKSPQQTAQQNVGQPLDREALRIACA